MLLQRNRVLWLFQICVPWVMSRKMNFVRSFTLHFCFLSYIIRFLLFSKQYPSLSLNEVTSVVLTADPSTLKICNIHVQFDTFYLNINGAWLMKTHPSSSLENKNPLTISYITFILEIANKWLLYKLNIGVSHLGGERNFLKLSENPHTLQMISSG